MTPADRALSTRERARLETLRSARSLAALRDITEVDSDHEAYFAAKREWAALRQRDLPAFADTGGIPGSCVEVGGVPIHVHGITHADSEAEGEFLRRHVARYLEEGAVVCCEQGIRSMYFTEVPGVTEIDDYRWATRECERLGTGTIPPTVDLAAFEGLAEEIDSVTASVRQTALGLIASGREVYGEHFGRALGDVVSELLASHEDVGTGSSFEAVRHRRAAAADPSKLATLQAYYETAFLPQPIEREWLARHDSELELMTHARNARMADYVVHEYPDASAVHLIVGAAHQPGVRYYLEQLRDGTRSLDGFEPIA